MIDCKINQINFVPLATNWFSARGEGGDYQNIATSILRLLWFGHQQLTLKEPCKIACISWNKVILINCLNDVNIIIMFLGPGWQGLLREKKNELETDKLSTKLGSSCGGLLPQPLTCKQNDLSWGFVFSLCLVRSIKLPSLICVKSWLLSRLSIAIIRI